MKGNLSGQGASLVIRTNGPDGQLQFATTQGDTDIKGDFDWTEYSISLDDIDSETDDILVFLLYLPETSGEVRGIF